MNNCYYQLKKLTQFILTTGTLSFLSSFQCYQINAQIIPDQTLGEENSVIVPNQIIKNLPSDLVEGGAIRGDNLFHSFSEFNINEARGVYFNNPNGIQNILTRVTGGNISQILGTLGVLGNANFYLINPNGIIFGNNASLDINGAFIGATADSVVFDNYEFSASNPQAPPLLNINIPLGLNFRENAGDIISQAKLSVPNDLTLAGKNLEINGEINTAGNLNLQAENNILSNTKYTVKGNFTGENLRGELGDLTSEEGTIIQTEGDVNFNSYTGASLQILAGGSVNIPGKVEINTAAASNQFVPEQIALSDGTEITVNGSETPTLDIRSGITNNQPPNLSNANININEIRVANGGQIFLTNQYQNNDLLGNINITNIDGVNTENSIGGANAIVDSRNQITLNGTIDVSGADYDSFTFITSNVQGNGGDVTFLAQDEIVFDSFASIFSAGLLGGNITIKSDVSISTNGGFIGSITTDEGKGGDINLKAPTITIDGGAEFFGGVFTTMEGIGKGGNVNVKARDLSIQNVGFIQTETFTDESGDIVIESESVFMNEGGFIATFLFDSSTGDGGIIDVTSKSLELYRGSQISFEVFGSGNGGVLNINAESIVLDGVDDFGFISGFISVAREGAQGNGGIINIQTKSLTVTNGAQIRSTTNSDGDAGIINIEANSISLDGFDIRDLDPETQTRNPTGIFSEALIINSELQDSILGNAGEISINTNELVLTNGAQISSSTDSLGNAGKITINANIISLDGKAESDPPFLAAPESRIGVDVASRSTGDGGVITLNTGNLALTNEARISANIQTAKEINNDNVPGNGGDIVINAAEAVTLDRGSISSAVSIAEIDDQETESIGNGGSILINTPQLLLNNNAQILSSTAGEGNAGTVTIDNANLVSLDNQSIISTAIESTGVATIPSNIAVETQQLKIKDNSTITAGVLGEGIGGNIQINATDNILLDRQGVISSALENTGTGKGGDIAITTANLNLSENSSITASTAGVGNAGNISISNHQTMTEKVSLNNSQISTEVESTAKLRSNPIPSNITIEAKQIFLENNANINASTSGEIEAGEVNIKTNNLLVSQGSNIETLTQSNQNAGDITIDSSQAVTIRGQESGLFAQTESGGDAGNIIINTPQLVIESSAQISAFSSGSGDGGNIIVTAPSDVTIRANSELTVETRNAGKAGDITIASEKISLGENAQISATATATSTNTEGGGSITINASNLILAGELGIFAETQGESPAGSLIIQPNNGQSNLDIEFTKTALISASTTASGQGGNIDIIAPSAIDVRGEGKITVETSGSGNAGNININTQDLTLSNGVEISASTIGEGNAGNIVLNAETINLTNAQIQSSTSSSGNAGDINLNLNGDFSLNNSQVLASTTSESTGKGGNINIARPQQVKLNNQSQITVNSQGQGDGGNVFLKASSLSLDNNSTISASTASGEGGNITLEIEESILLNNHSTITATAGGTGNGGNIDIESEFLIAADNSDITANAFEGRGGNINITAQGIFLKDSLITASSELGVDGIVETNTPEVDPSRGIVELTVEVVDPSQLIAENVCKPGEKSEFILTGKGGLPTSPNQPLERNITEVELIEPVLEEINSESENQSSIPASENKQSIIPAKGWIWNNQGQVVLIGYDPHNVQANSQRKNKKAVCQPNL